MRYSRVLSLLLLFFCFAALTQAQGSVSDQEPLTTLHSTARTVVVDVVATDKSGRAIPDLRQADFQVFEDGRPQIITFFESHDTPGNALPAAPSLPPGVFTNVPTVTPNEAINILLIDALNTQLDDQMYVHRQMVKYLEKLPAHARVGVFLLSNKLSLVQGFTQDSTVLRAALERYAKNPSPSSLLMSPTDNATQQQIITQAQQAFADPSVQGNTQGASNGDAQMLEQVNALQEFLQHASENEGNNRLLITLSSLKSLGHYLAGIPGRKNLLWFVGNFPTCLPPSCPYLDLYQETTSILASARVSIYPIDASGLFTLQSNIGGPSGAPGIGITAAASEKKPNTSTLDITPHNTEAINNNARFLDSENWARSTGGKAFHGNDPEKSMQEAIEHGSRYYTLAYIPSNAREDGRERKIKINTLQKGISLSYRNSYFERSSKEKNTQLNTPPQDMLRPMMDRGMPNFSELPFRMQVTLNPAQPDEATPHAGENVALKAPLKRLNVGFTLSLATLNPSPDSDGVRRRPLQVTLLVYSQRGELLNWESRQIRLAIRPDQLQAASTTGIPFHLQIDTPPGDTYLRAGIYDATSGHSGTLEIPLREVLGY